MDTVIMNKFNPIIGVEIENNVIKKITDIKNKHLLPFILMKDLSVESINEWYSKRLIPEKRERYNYVKQLLSKSELEKQSYASLSDQYWVKRYPIQKWKNINFFENDFSNDIGQLFFLPYKVEKKNMNYFSPDLTTNGCLRKRWIKNKDGIFLLKSGNAKMKQEPLNEVLATILLGKLKVVDFVRYEYVIDNMELCSKCKNFITEDTEFVPAYHLYMTVPKNNKLESVYDHLLHTCDVFEIKDAKKFIDAMIAIDFLMSNTDRHLGNFGFIRNVKDGKIIGFAPLFDFGNAFYNTDKIDNKHIFVNEEKRCINDLKTKISINTKDLENELLEVTNDYIQITNIRKEKVKDMIEKNINTLKDKKLELIR